jgi:hypothetical protein
MARKLFGSVLLLAVATVAHAAGIATLNPLITRKETVIRGMVATTTVDKDSDLSAFINEQQNRTATIQWTATSADNHPESHCTANQSSMDRAATTISGKVQLNPGEIMYLHASGASCTFDWELLNESGKALAH